MKRTEQRRFILELIANVRADVLKQAELFPEEWDGHEIRQFIADRFQESSWTLRQNKARFREYQNTVAVMGRR